ncbi:hypothetical protein [Methylophilus sp. Leaf408]|nr:hypothetical protein [Methylophilus sp. Leaf408]
MPDATLRAGVIYSLLIAYVASYTLLLFPHCSIRLAQRINAFQQRQLE